jgi:hypothetical protein
MEEWIVEDGYLFRKDDQQLQDRGVRFMNELCRYLPLWIQVRDPNIPSREGISKQFWRFLRPLIIASFASSTAVVQNGSDAILGCRSVWSQILYIRYSSLFMTQMIRTDAVVHYCTSVWFIVAFRILPAETRGVWNQAIQLEARDPGVQNGHRL